MSQQQPEIITSTEHAPQIWEVMQASYKIEASLLELENFYPLTRTVTAISQSSNLFYGYFESNELAGVCEVEFIGETAVLIASLVVHPSHFRKGIASKLIAYVTEKFADSDIWVSTAVKNTPAVNLYLKSGFTESHTEALPDGLQLIKLRWSAA